MYLLGTGGSIPPKSVGRATLNTRFFPNVLILCIVICIDLLFLWTEYMETACEINEDVVMHPFAFRTHAHTHGRLFIA